jgi:uncharacterized membrane protein
MVHLHALRERLRLSLWFLPAVFAVAAAGLAIAFVAIDRELTARSGSLFFTFGGTAEGARSVLSTIAQSMLTFTGLVFTITMLVLQLASSQLSPRVMRTFLRDRANQVVLGLFVATFVFTLLVLRDVRAPVDGDGGFVPALSIWVAFTLLLASVGAFIYYIDHMAHAIRASTVLANIAAETAETIERLYPERVGREPEPDDVATARELGPASLTLKSERAGILVTVDEESLLGSTRHDARRLEVLAAVGDFVPSGAPLMQLWGTWDRAAVDAARDAVGIGSERTLEQDAAFGLRQLVDVAVRALSPGTNDPTTAVQSVDRIHDMLRRLAVRQIPSPYRVDEDGRLRLILPRPSWEEYVHLGVDEIRIAGEGQLQVGRRLRQLLEDIASVAPDDRLPVLRHELARLEAGVERSFADAGDRDAAFGPVRRGWWSAAADERRER